MNSQYRYLINGGYASHITPMDRGLSYGDGVFRTLKVLSRCPDNWSLHYQKLSQDCSALGIVCPSQELLLNDMEVLFQETSSGIAKIIVTRGEGERGYAPPAVTSPTRIVMRCALPTYPAHYLTHGVKLFACDTRLSHQPKLAGVKHLNRLENVLARSEWQDPDFADGVMLDIMDKVIECTSANLFVRKGDVLLTPSLHQCGVAGVTRERVLTLAPELKLRAVVKLLSMDEVFDADEWIICNSVYGAWQVSEYQHCTWPMGELAADLRRLIAV